jgi:hypothetical protein
LSARQWLWGAVWTLVMVMAVVLLLDPWALRRFVICSRPDTVLSATARLLLEHLAAQAGRPRRT